jgi:hypothetical protein
MIMKTSKKREDGVGTHSEQDACVDSAVLEKKKFKYFAVRMTIFKD